MFSSTQTQGSASAGNAAGLARWLGLAAAPTFAVMALLTAANGGADMICSTIHNTLPLDGMVVMYLLMSVFHLPPWLRLIFGRAKQTSTSS